MARYGMRPDGLESTFRGQRLADFTHEELVAIINFVGEWQVAERDRLISERDRTFNLLARRA